MMRPSPNPLRLAVLAALALASSATRAGVFITIDVDSPTVLAGNFSMPGTGFNEQSFDLFSALPGGDNFLSLARIAGNREYFGSDTEGLPTIPIFVRGGTSAFSGGSRSGQYTNGGPDQDQTVNFNFFNLADTGGPTGTFSGQFVFVNVTAVPEPSAYAALTGLALAGFALWRRRSAK